MTTKKQNIAYSAVQTEWLKEVYKMDYKRIGVEKKSVEKDLEVKEKENIS
jgi:lysine/ornithine N-monooxygenase